ncbi:hypothetical protein [Niallia sp. 03190]|uniref:hypothetical protein n=1 Tax=Niallia sp. 03190 TaxID=3458061 RepID=UPI00404444EC
MLKAPLLELLGYMILNHQDHENKKKNEEMRIWINYLSMVNSHPLSEGSKPEIKESRRKFIDFIQPKQKVEDESPKTYEWDFKQLNQIKSMQEGG